MDRWMDGCMVGWMDGWIDGWIWVFGTVALPMTKK